jgi:hypothetical protein
MAMTFSGTSRTRKPKLDFPHKQSRPLTRMKNGGDGRNRTDDPLLAKQVLYQLSYIPKLWAI